MGVDCRLFARGAKRSVWLGRYYWYAPLADFAEPFFKALRDPDLGASAAEMRLALRVLREDAEADDSGRSFDRDFAFLYAHPDDTFFLLNDAREDYGAFTDAYKDWEP